MVSGVDHRVNAKTKELVLGLVVLGHTKEHIARRLGICSETLTKHYAYELEHGKADIDCVVVDKLLEQAKEGNLKAIMFYLTHRCGWAAAKIKEDTSILDNKTLAELIMMTKESINLNDKQ